MDVRRGWHIASETQVNYDAIILVGGKDQKVSNGRHLYISAHFDNKNSGTANIVSKSCAGSNRASGKNRVKYLVQHPPASSLELYFPIIQLM